MSQEFKLNFNGMRDPATSNSGGEKSHSLENKNEYYPSAGNVRNICFSWPDGRSVFLNYAYLIAGEYDPVNNSINLHFTNHNVIITGKKLKALFAELFFQKTQNIELTEGRYSNLQSDSNWEVFKMEIQSNQ